MLLINPKNKILSTSEINYLTLYFLLRVKYLFTFKFNETITHIQICSKNLILKCYKFKKTVSFLFFKFKINIMILILITYFYSYQIQVVTL